MSLKIIGGVAKGFTLITPSESITRPTSVLLKRRLFDYYQNLEGFYFFDICAGSGSIGIEAASRGASPVMLIESNHKAFTVIQKNITQFKTKYNIHIDSIKKEFQKWFKDFISFYDDLSKDEQERIILFFDPPYEKIDLYRDFFEFVSKDNFTGIAIIEACRHKTMSEDDFVKNFGEPSRNYRQGTSFLYLYDYNIINSK
jgi:16S rRNA (guanine966-N2)-methyltransferase